ncbi:DUF4153 domain-containing protein [Alkalibacterium thalassium]|uniref:DUF4153 domain-containing protein n=1 Tax=Alkalibacterium thalassium TaxID=426701 RepID=A0A1G9AE69_9LACT|nr:DUF4153 domain-containing protein [Alkalibacterium thalassium]SDK24810.1 protein of unknown function [Alkalibacterium thalassium]
MNRTRLFARFRQRSMAVFGRFPLSIFFLAVTTLIVMADIQLTRTSLTREAFSAGLGALFLACGQLWNEKNQRQKTRSSWLILLVSAVSAFLYYIYLRQINFASDQSAMIRTIVVIFIASVMLITIPTSRTAYTFSQSLVAYIRTFFSSLLLAVVFYIGVAAILATFSTLFIQLSFEWYSHSAALIFLFFAPVYFLSGIPDFFRDKNDQAVTEAISRPKILAVLVDFIVVPLILIFSALLVAYIAANITGEFWLDSLIEPMLISYVAVGFITLFLTEQSSKQWVHLFNRYFPYLLLVIAVFQSISSSIKSFQFGLTHGRYFVLLFGLFAISGVIIYGFFKSASRYIPLILIALGTVSILPFIDSVSIGTASQIRQVEDIIQADNFDDNGRIRTEVSFSHEERNQLSYSFNYLNNINELERLDWLPERFDYYNNFQTVFGFDPYYFANHNSENGEWFPVETEYAYVELDNEQPVTFSVAGMDDMVYFSVYQSEGFNEDKRIDLNQENTELIIQHDDEVFSLELEENDEVIMVFDLSFLQEDIYDLQGMSQARPLEDLTFVEENEEVVITLIVNRFETDRNAFYGGDFTVLLDYK